MAFCYITTCSECGKEFNAINYARRCDDCRNAEEQEKKEQWMFEIRVDKTLEERICAIEEMLYDIKKHKHFDSQYNILNVL